TRWSSVDFSEDAIAGEKMPDLYLRLGTEAGGAGERVWLGRRNRGFPKTRRDRDGGLWQRAPGSVGDPSRRKPPFLVLWRRLHLGSANGIPEAATKGHRRGVGPVHHRQRASCRPGGSAA